MKDLRECKHLYHGKTDLQTYVQIKTDHAQSFSNMYSATRQPLGLVNLEKISMPALTRLLVIVWFCVVSSCMPKPGFR